MFFQQICRLWLSSYGSNVCSLLVLEDDRGVEKMIERLGYFCDEISTLIIAVGVIMRRLEVLEDGRCETEIHRPICRLEWLFQSRLRFVSCVFESAQGRTFFHMTSLGSKGRTNRSENYRA